MQLLKPLALSLGDTIGVIAPSFPLLPAWRPDYERGKEMLRTLGFAIKEGRTMGLTRYWAAAKIWPKGGIGLTCGREEGWGQNPPDCRVS